VGASLLTALGLPELIAADVEAYVAAAVRLAADRATLDGLKARLDTALATTPVFDPAAFADRLEEAFERMIRGREAGLSPAGFDIDPV
jgi:protein O-GlcNAc transferase